MQEVKTLRYKLKENNERNGVASHGEFSTEWTTARNLLPTSPVSILIEEQGRRDV